MTEAEALVRVAEELADSVLFPAALETDVAPLVPVRNLDALAEAGLYGIAGPREFGGSALNLPSLCAVVEALAGGCLATAFVWVQHNTPVRTLAASPNEALKQEWLPEMCAGAGARVSLSEGCESGRPR